MQRARLGGGHVGSLQHYLTRVGAVFVDQRVAGRDHPIMTVTSSVKPAAMCSWPSGESTSVEEEPSPVTAS